MWYHYIDDAYQIEVVNCTLDGRVYVRKSIEKLFALRTREVQTPHLLNVASLILRVAMLTPDRA